MGCLHGLFINVYIASESVVPHTNLIPHLMAPQMHNAMFFENPRKLCIMDVIYFNNHRRICLDCSGTSIG